MALSMVVGLGNPGTEYEGTRHNIGFQVVELLARRHGIAIRKREHRAVTGSGSILGAPVLLARPMTFMNLSGEAVGSLARWYRVEPIDIIVVVDDIALATGRLRMRLQGSAGGHNGLTSIERNLGVRTYPRVRVGVGAARPGAMVDHVLGRFSRSERTVMDEAVERAADAVESALRHGFENAMNLFNRDPEARAEDPAEKPGAE